MKKIISLLFCFIGRLIALVYPSELAIKLKWIRNIIYTNSISSKFKYFGTKSLFHYPITLLGEKYISVGSNNVLGTRSVLTAWDKYEGDNFCPEISIGNNVCIGEDCHITAINKIIIGDHVLIGKKVTISDNSHGKTDELSSFCIPPIKRRLYFKGAVIIESGVWIGDKATILSGVKIGQNSIIGANSVVTKDIPENSIAVGVPAKIIKKTLN